MQCASDPTIIVVGDDDQNIYEFRGSSIEHMIRFVEQNKAFTYYLDTNYRALSNHFQDYFTGSRMKLGRPMLAASDEDGNITLVKYTSQHLVTPAVEHLARHKPKGTTALLVATNSQALHAASLLHEKGIAAKLITEQEGFRLRDIEELRLLPRR